MPSWGSSLDLVQRPHQEPAFIYDHFAEGSRYDPASQVTQILHQLTATSTQINKADYLSRPPVRRGFPSDSGEIFSESPRTTTT
jgi:hypothetical protein